MPSRNYKVNLQKCCVLYVANTSTLLFPPVFVINCSSLFHMSYCRDLVKILSSLREGWIEFLIIVKVVMEVGMGSTWLDGCIL